MDGMLEITLHNTAHVRRRFREGATLLPSLPAPLSVEASCASFDLYYSLKALYLPGYAGYSRLCSGLQKGAGLLLFPAPFWYQSRLLPPGASFLLLPAGSGTFMSFHYSGGPNGMHNVVGHNQGLWPWYLELSNTSQTVGSLSFAKPPHEQSSFAAFRTVPDRRGLDYLR